MLIYRCKSEMPPLSIMVVFPPYPYDWHSVVFPPSYARNNKECPSHAHRHSALSHAHRHSALSHAHRHSALSHAQSSARALCLSSSARALCLSSSTRALCLSSYATRPPVIPPLPPQWGGTPPPCPLPGGAGGG